MTTNMWIHSDELKYLIHRFNVHYLPEDAINPFLANIPFLFRLKTPGGIKWEHWPEMS